MFHSIDPKILKRMWELEAMDLRDRGDGTPLVQRLRQIPPETGRFLAILLAQAPNGSILELGTSAGYSTLWLTLAARESDRIVRTFEVHPDKIALARETFAATATEESVELVDGDALDALPDERDVAFCFLDTEKHLYAACYESVVPNLVAGGILVADNTINHHTTLRPVIDRAFADSRVDAVDVPIGMGLLLVRKT